MADFRCICDHDLQFESDSPKPYAVRDCPAHRARRAYQQAILSDPRWDQSYVTPKAWEAFNADR